MKPNHQVAYSQQPEATQKSVTPPVHEPSA